MWLFLAVANVSTWKVTKGKLIYFIHIAMANDFMYGVPPRHTHGENRVNNKMVNHNNSKKQNNSSTINTSKWKILKEKICSFAKPFFLVLEQNKIKVLIHYQQS